jgi:hypothetical protein
VTEPRRGARAVAGRAAVAIAPPLRRLLAERDELARSQRRLNRAAADHLRQIAELKSHIAALESAEPATDRAPPGYLFIVSYGRSGSTLLQGVLNSIPGYLIRGENRGSMYRLHQFHSALENARAEFAQTASLTAADSWFGIDEYATATAISRMRALVLDALLRPGPDTRVVGFKEIRWWQRDWPAYLAFLRELFPGARFVLNTRDHAAVVKSQWWGKRPEHEVHAELATYEMQLTSMAERLGRNAYRVHYDDYIADPGTLAGLFEWLGEPLDRRAVDAVLKVRHSF